MSLGLVFASAGCGADSSSPAAASAGAATMAGGAPVAGTNTGGAAAGIGGAAAGTGGAAAGVGGNGSGGGGDGNGGTSSGGATAGAAPTTGGAVNLYVDQVRAREGCLPRPLPVVETESGGFTVGQVRCQVAVVTEATDPACSCDAAQGLKPAATGLAEAVLNNARQSGSCGAGSNIDCNSLCICELQQYGGAALTQCQNDATKSPELPGFCYVDVGIAPPLGNPALVASCPQSSRRELRILGPVPEPAPLLFLGCSGANLGDL